MPRCLLVGVAGASLLLCSCARPNPLFGESSETGGDAGDTAAVQVTDGQTGAMGPSLTVGEGTTVAKDDDDDDDDADGTTASTDTSTDVGESGDDKGMDVSSTSSDTGDTGDTGDTDTGVALSPCCENIGEPGCADPMVEACVCDSDPFCCSNLWDALCIESAVGNCGIECHNESTCCATSNGYGCGDSTIETCVCNLEPECCNINWTVQCMFLATDSCMADCFSDEDCCTAVPDVPGCEEPQVWECVCSMDAFCCDVEWDGMCIMTAEDSCGLLCP